MMVNQVEGILLDMDGLLINSETLSAEAWIIAANAQDVVVDNEFCSNLIGLNSKDCDGKFQSQFPSLDLARLRSDWERETVDMINRGRLTLLPGVEQFLLELQNRDIPHIVATSSQRDLAIKKLCEVGLGRLADQAVTGDQVRRGKPAPDIFIEGMNRLNLAPRQCL